MSLAMLALMACASLEPVRRQAPIADPASDHAPEPAFVPPESPFAEHDDEAHEHDADDATDPHEHHHHHHHGGDQEP